MLRVIGIDYGRKRMGLAVSDPFGSIALPCGARAVRSLAEAVEAAAAFVRERQAGTVVVGLPLHMNGSEGEMALEARAFGVQLGAAVSLPVVYIDERLTSAMVERMLIGADVRRVKRREVVDSLAAQAILQSYLDRQSIAAPEESGADADPDDDRL